MIWRVGLRENVIGSWLVSRKLSPQLFGNAFRVRHRCVDHHFARQDLKSNLVCVLEGWRSANRTAPEFHPRRGADRTRGAG